MQDYQDFAQTERFREQSLAVAFVKWQYFDRVYDDLEKAYRIGTIFPDLNKPFTGRRCVS